MSQHFEPAFEGQILPEGMFNLIAEQTDEATAFEIFCNVEDGSTSADEVIAYFTTNHEVI